MRKAVYAIAAAAAVVMLGGCAHTGLVTGPAAPQASVDRGAFIEPLTPEAAPFDSVPHVDIDTLWEQGVLPEQAAARIRSVQSKANAVRVQIINAGLYHQALDMTLPAPVLPEPDETLQERLRQAEADCYGTPAPQE